MQTTLSFRISQTRTGYAVASTFTAYLLGAEAFENRLMGVNHRVKGPFSESAGSWKLDESGHFFLTVAGTEASLSCRYESQVPTIKAMVSLYQAQYGFVP